MAPAVDQSTPLVGGPHPASAPVMVHYMQDDAALAGREIDLPMTEGKYAKMVDPSMPLMLQNVMTRDEYKHQVEEINDLLHKTSDPYVKAISNYIKVVYGIAIVMLASFLICFVLIFFTFGLSFIVLFFLWLVLIIFSFAYRLTMRSKIKTLKDKGDEQSRHGLNDISDKWAPRGIAWRQKEGSAQMMVSTRRRGMMFTVIRPLVIYVELAPNAAQLFRATQGGQSAPAVGYPQQQQQQQQQQPQQAYPPQYPPQGMQAYPQQGYPQQGHPQQGFQQQAMYPQQAQQPVAYPQQAQNAGYPQQAQPVTYDQQDSINQV
eukprot:CAMPEP_0114623454 /NCGR_PEP_ID=MMETSP0168-20121206/10259_1 /TAXON_ID=95228 ORGANISM="Vannella sp., Strain DIVA3 517/6/12" /NCGR_SAMPLE_ID=MMETSP0168 /ASSEMBLY_ACC=CAM_ASM_000044 /LENGTH=317 /DNA_ID=CAMNT_0001834697 /DNA_START=21 /DNA_END=974 /DNA_ORIENTATION=-